MYYAKSYFLKSEIFVKNNPIDDNNNSKQAGPTESTLPSRPIGIHVRLQQGLPDVIDTVQRLNVSVAQSFLLTESGKYASISHKIVADFIKQKERLNFLYFVNTIYSFEYTFSNTPISKDRFSSSTVSKENQKFFLLSVE